MLAMCPPIADLSPQDACGSEAWFHDKFKEEEEIPYVHMASKGL